MADSSNTRLDLDAIEERANAATKGPWRFGVMPEDEEWMVVSDSIVERVDDPDPYTYHRRIIDGSNYATDEDMAFIIYAREDVPALVAEVRRLRADSVESSESVRLAEALRALKDAAKQIDFARPGQLTAEEGWALIHADDEAFEVLAEFGQQPTGDDT